MKNKTVNNKKAVKTKKPKKHVIITLISFVFTMIVAVMLAGSGMTILVVSSMLEDKPVFEVDNFNSNESSKIYDINGDLIADIGLHLRENVTFDQIPQTVVDAFVAIEDSRFFTHNGFDIPRFAVALLGNLRGIITGSSGFSAGGGSTLTMQLVKGTYFETEDALAPTTIERKMQEIALALETEESVSKRRIFELYVNRINYGVPSSRGLQTAAQYYFGKNTQELSLSEAAYLAGVINAPTTFNAYNNLEAATRRRNVVLFQMRRHGYISDAEYQEAINIPLENLLAGRTTIEGRPYQAYIDAVVKEVIGLTGRDPYTTPMNIYTYMQPVIQQQIDDIQNGNVNFEFIDELLQTSGVVMDHTTGQVVGIMGGRNYDGERLLNRALEQRNQIGSTAKGILTYPLAFEHLNVSTSEVTKDEPILISGTNFILRNFDRRYRGEMTIKSAFGNSMNIPAYQYLERTVGTIGISRVVDYINSLGISTTSRLFDLGFAFGGSNFVASPMQLNAAYGAIFNDGQYIQPHTVSRIEFRDGSDPLVPQYASTRVISSAASYLTLDLMRDAIYGGYANGLAQFRRNAFVTYGKSGTTNYGPEGSQFGIPDGSAKEHWIVVGNTKYVATVWIGFDKAEAGRNTYITNAINSQNYRGRIMNLLIDSVAKVQSSYPELRQPSTVVPITHILGPQPYLTPFEGLNPSLITTGLIKSGGSGTIPVPFPTPSNMGAFTSSVSGTVASQTLTIQVPAYPDELATQREPVEYQMELITPTQQARATGTRLFSYSWIRGPIVYVARVVINGEAQQFVSNTPTIQIPLTNYAQGNVEVCTYYAYEKFLNERSNVVCQVVTTADPNVITIPNWVNQSLSQFMEWMQKLGLTNVNFATSLASTPEVVGRISAFDPAGIMNTNIHVNDLKARTITLTYADRTIDLSTLIGRTRDYAYNSWPLRNFVTISDASSSISGLSIISDVLVNGVSTSSIQVSKNNKITLVYATP